MGCKLEWMQPTLLYEIKMKRELAIYVDHLRRDFNDFSQKVKTAGFDYICTQDSIEWINMKNSERERIIKKTREKLEMIKLKNLAHHSCPILFSLDREQKKAIKYHLKIIEEIKDWRISFWVLHNRSIKDESEPWRKLEEIGKDKFDKLVCYVLKEICQYASQYKISIALENTPYRYSKSVKDILEIIEKVNQPNLGICFDSGHSNICNLSLKREILSCKNKLFTTHFHDNMGNRKKVSITDKNISKYDLHLVPGLGIINWVEVNKTLDEINYKYPVAFEGIGGIENEDELLEITVKLWRIFEKLSLKTGGA